MTPRVARWEREPPLGGPSTESAEAAQAGRRDPFDRPHGLPTHYAECHDRPRPARTNPYLSPRPDPRSHKAVDHTRIPVGRLLLHLAFDWMTHDPYQFCCHQPGGSEPLPWPAC